jgi:hypothetical protein
MDRASHYFLARASFALEYHRQIAGRSPHNRLQLGAQVRSSHKTWTDLARQSWAICNDANAATKPHDVIQCQALGSLSETIDVGAVSAAKVGNNDICPLAMNPCVPPRDIPTQETHRAVFVSANDKLVACF